jgi:hypothetical protein
MPIEISRPESYRYLNRLTGERRICSTRTALPSCPLCAGEENAVVVHADYVLYLRCYRCPHVWSIGKPGVLPIGS